ncbi:hypothetical protein [Microlunatus parietis]|uniref:Uncharacterized protein n=1 Tax=Microlunatus parietis TaxID=682979 RepID=A0A7Y9I8D5_9ACTN|nr:hypothetical protein [Microlunatus parietis]NYE71903.1 hypothetical protein [Microlunatus parietis]
MTVTNAADTGGGAGLNAWVDESMRIVGDSGDYILAAAVGDPTALDAVRDTLRGLLKGRQVRLHWHTENNRRRADLASAVGCFDLASIVVVGTPMVRAKQERARRKCLERLLHELDQLGVERVYTEARSPRLNVRDQRMVDALRVRGVIGESLRVEIGRPTEEPMLWVPDIVAGAVAGSRAGAADLVAPLRQVLTEIQVTL